MHVQLKFLHSVTEPPKGRSKKPKVVQHPAEYSVEIRELTDEQAPISWIETMVADPHFAKKVEGSPATHSRIWRWFEETLWVPEYDRYSGIVLEMPKLEYSYFEDPRLGLREELMPGKGRPFNTLAERIQGFDEWAAKLAIVDGAIYSATGGEPRYKIQYQKDQYQMVQEYEYSLHTNKGDYYRIDQVKAIEQEVGIYLKRRARETELVWLATYEIRIPEAVRLQPQRDGAIQEEEKYQVSYKEFSSKLGWHFTKKPDQIRAVRQKLAEMEAAGEG